jgi:hypothetical protein
VVESPLERILKERFRTIGRTALSTKYGCGLGAEGYMDTNQETQNQQSACQPHAGVA